MLLANIWKEKGLTNGANGYVKYIVYKEGEKPPQLPRFVLVYFPQYTGPSFIPGQDGIVPIEPLTRTWNESKIQLSRRMLPLVSSYAITIHKSQG